jgi:parallel beta-helix repeat protein
MNRLGWGVAGALAIALVASIAGVIYADPLDPPAGVPTNEATQERLIYQPDGACPAGFPITLSAPGSYRLAQNITGCSGVNGIEITADGVTLDMNGFTVTGPGGAGVEGGIVSVSAAAFHVRNGTVRDWPGFGVYSTGGTSGSIEAITVIDSGGVGGAALLMIGGTVKDCRADGSGASFYAAIVVSRATIHDCLAVDSPGRGFDVFNSSASNLTAIGSGATGIYLANSTGSNLDASNGASIGIFATLSSLTGAQAEFNDADGISCDNSLIMNSSVSWNGDDGIEGFQCQIVDNRARNNTMNGIRVLGGGCGGLPPCFTADGARVAGNTASNNSASGILVEGDDSMIEGNTASDNAVNGIAVTGDGNRIDSNHVAGSGAAGFSIAASGPHENLIMRNTSVFNVGVPYAIGAGNEFGPVSTLIAATNPWANTHD